MIDQESLENLKADLIQCWGQFYQDFIDAIEELKKAWEQTSDLLEEIKSAFYFIEKRNKLKLSWKIQKSVKIPVLFLDKRKKVHKCRNSC